MDEDNTANSVNGKNCVVLGSSVSNDRGSSDINIALGMAFRTAEEIEKLYDRYAESKGFRIRRRNSRANVIQLVCNREGFHKLKREIDLLGGSSNKEPYRITKSSRIGCCASLHCSLNPTTKLWHITKFDDLHNHDMLTPESNKYLRTHKRIPKSAKVLPEVFENQDIPIGGVVNALNVGPEVEFTDKDCCNHVTGVGRKRLDGGEARAVFEYCVRQQEENPNFRYSISLDNDDRITNFFWVDARSRMAYRIFGDVVRFDATYRRNKYNILFASFVGVDNHMRTILFGCALLQDETEESFSWLFEAWLHAMDGKHPVSFITDKDPAVMNSVGKVFPTTKHCLSLWRVTKEFPKRFSHIYHKEPKFKTDLDQCIHKSMSIQDFEMLWERLVAEYNLTGNDWLQNLYSLRHLWVPCFNKNVFLGGMNTADKSESIYAIFDAYIKSGMTLKELVLKCQEAVDSHYEVIKRGELDSKHRVPVLTLHMGLEKHGSIVYTSEIFELFCKELTGILGCRRHLLHEESARQVYRVEYNSEPDVQVEYDTSTKESSCECMLFECKGILCKHVLSIYFVHNVVSIPSNYIVNRWTKGAALSIFTCDAAYRVGSLASMRSLELKESLNKLYEMCELSDDVLKYVKEGIEELLLSAKRKFSGNLDGMTGNENVEEEDNNNPQLVQPLQIHDPSVIRAKGGRRASKRKMSRIQSVQEEA